jgi:hypothetical protein
MEIPLTPPGEELAGGAHVPILPLIDLLILLGWTSLLVGFAQKAIWISTSYRPGLLGLAPMDFVVIAGICLVFALSLAARTWVKLNEPRLVALQRRLAIADARRAAEDAEYGADDDEEDELSPVAMASMNPRSASADHR